MASLVGRRGQTGTGKVRGCEAERSRRTADGAQPVWLTEGAEEAEPIPPLPTFTNEQLPRTTPEWLRRILNWRPVELHHIRTTQPTPTAPEDDEQEGADRDDDPEDSTTCPDSESVYSLSTGATEEDEESLDTPENQRSTLDECFSAWLRYIGAE